ncbi:MAG: M20 family metallopeptidase [Gammaproteobacteria bacterium]|jgi:hippurate hydrolase
MDMELPPESLTRRITELRREIHRHPELAFEEVRTAERISTELRRLGLMPEYGGPGTGVIARLDGNGRAGPVVALRAEMDALPGEETTGLEFASLVPGKVHACGHDAHMAMVLGAAEMLVERPPPGRTLFLFEPAEESGGGARTLIDAGALEGVNAIFGGHVTHHYATGEIMVADGIVTAQSDTFVIRVTGRGGHGARPHEAVDAVIVAGLLISAIQTLVTRELNPFHPTVVTIGKLTAGSAGNVIAEEAVLEGTIRTTDPKVREHVIAGIKRMGEAAATLHRARVAVNFADGYPPVINTAREALIARKAAGQVVGPDGLVAMEYPSMGAEDFSFFLQQVPGCYVRFGARPPGSDYIPLHSPAFTIDERVLPIGAAFFNRVVREAIGALAREAR